MGGPKRADKKADLDAFKGAVKGAMEPKHTPTPWTWSDDGGIDYMRGPKGEYIGYLAGPTGNSEADEQTKANRSFVFLAVNAYENDQETIKELLEGLKRIMRETESSQGTFMDVRKIVAGLIAKAEEE